MLSVLKTIPGSLSHGFLRASSIAALTTLGWLASAQAQAPLAEPILPVPQAHKEDARKAALGGKLFNDPRLSGDNTVSCASCHNLSKGGADVSALSKGLKGRQGQVNAPTVLNSSMNFRQFWDGRASSLEEQVAGPVHDPNEMGSNWAEILEKLNNSSVSLNSGSSFSSSPESAVLMRYFVFSTKSFISQSACILRSSS